MRLAIACVATLSFGLLANAFSWGSRHKGRLKSVIGNDEDFRSLPRLPNIYSMALSELQDLESEPLCHRNAARLLVNHCQLLEGKDDATVLTDSGRAARDFVDSYAASLAICDLERGSFRIPSTCHKFREATLSALPVPTKPELHVTTPEIDSCLEGLAQSDSAWNTWVSYRHKALRFCEAARVDNEKDQHLRLYQRVTRILSKLTVEVEAEMETRRKNLDKAFDRTSSRLDNLGTQIELVTSGLDNVEHLVSTHLPNAAETSREIMNRASADAKTLQDLLAAMVRDTMQRTEDMASSYETALQSFTVRANDDTETIITTLATAASSTVLLQNELENSQTRAEEVTLRQREVEAGMHQLQIYVDAMSSRYNEHGERLKEAQRRADEILETLDSVASSAASFQSSISTTLGLKGWWPYIYCPLASLVMGSYGLPPSATRNVVLVGLGEVAGYLVSNIADHIKASLLPEKSVGAGGTEPNITYFRGDSQSDADLTSSVPDLRFI